MQAINSSLLNHAVPTSVRVLDVQVTSDLTTLNFSAVIQDKPTRLQVLDLAFAALLPILDGHVRTLEVQVLYGGKALARTDLKAQAFDCAGATRFEAGTVRSKPSSITDAKVMLNPGHGFYLKTSGLGAWQRPVPPSSNPTVYVLEDTSNAELAMRSAQALAVTGASVRSVRNLDKNAGVGITGKAKWEEAALHHLATQAYPAGVWDSEGNALFGDCAQGKDIRARAWAANYWGADALVGLHSNASNDPSIRGTRIYFPSTPFLADTPSSTPGYARELARLLGNSLRDSIRSKIPSLNWPEPILFASDEYGETGFAKMPSVIVEIGYHTNPTDGAALADDAFRVAVAAGIKDGLTQFFGPAVAQTPQWQATPTSINFGTGNVGSSLTTLLVLKNAGSNGSYSITSNDPGLGSASSSGTLAAGASTSISLTASCSSAGAKTGTLTISGGGSSVQVNASWSCSGVVVPPVTPITPTPLTVSMSSNGKILLTWPEVPTGSFYEFKATFENTDLDVTGKAQSKGSMFGGAVATFTENPSAADKNGKTVCFAIRAVNSSNLASAFSGFSCTPYRYYTNGLTIQSRSDNQIFLSSK